MNSPGAALPKYVWVDTYQQYVRLYDSPQSIDYTEFTPNVPNKIAVLQASVPTYNEQSQGYLFGGPVAAPAAQYGMPGAASTYVWSDIIEEVEMASKPGFWASLGTRVVASGAFWRALKIGVFAGLALFVLNAVYSPIASNQPDGRGGRVITFCTSDLFGSRTCHQCDTTDKNCTGTWQGSNTLGDIAVLIGAVAALGIGAYIFVKFVGPAMKKG